MSDTDKTNPFEKEVTLPSRGKFYGGKLPGGSVTLRPIKVAEEKLLAGSGNKMALADKVLQRCILSPCIPLRDMILTDKFYLLLVLRNISYGPEYQFQVKCSTCSTQFKRSITLPEGLGLKMAVDTDMEPFDVTLPQSAKVVSLRFMRGSDEEETEAFIKGLPAAKSDEGDPAYEFKLSRYIVRI